MSAHLPPYSVVLSGHCNRVRCEPGWHLGPDWAPRLRDYDLWYVSAGRGRMTTSDGEVALAPGVCLWMRPGRRYEAVHDRVAPLVVNFFHFTLGAKPGPFVPPVEVMHTAHPDFADAVMRRVLTLHAKREASARASAERLLGALLSELVREATARATDLADAGLTRHHREMIHRLAAGIRENPARARSIGELAQSVGYSVDHFSRVFARITGRRPQDFVIEARLTRARQLLAETGLNIGQIAASLGYNDVYFFSKQFRQKTGLTPTKYRSTLPHSQAD